MIPDTRSADAEWLTSPRLRIPTILLFLLMTGNLRTFSSSMCRTALARSSSSRQRWISSVITSRAVAPRASLCFEPSKSQFRDALISLVPQKISEDEPFPGSLLSHASALASPSTFIWSRLIDAALSVGDPLAMEIHARVERWALDEFPLPGKLVHQIID